MKSEEIEGVEYPVTVKFADGSTQQYEDESDLEMNLEEFDSAKSPGCRVTDAKGREMNLAVKWMCVLRLELKNE